MADEAVLRIVLQDNGGGGGGPAASQASAPQSAVMPVAQPYLPVKPVMAPGTVSAECAKLKPPTPKETGLDSILQIVDSLRGVIGGLAGATVGAVLDVVSGFRKALAIAAENRQQVPSSGGMHGTSMAAVGMASKSATGAGVAATSSAAEGAGGAAAGGMAAAGALAVAVPIVGAFVAVIALAVTAVNAFIDAVDARVERLAQYSPEIAQAQAIAEVRQTMNDLRRAQQYGPELARYVQAKAELQEKIEDMKLRFMMKILPIITRVMEFLEAAMSIGEGVEKAISSLFGPLAAITGASNNIAQTINDVSKPPPNDPTELILRRSELFATTSQGGFVPEL